MPLLRFLDFATVYLYFNIRMCCYLKLERKYFVSLKNESFLFWTRVHLQGEVKFSKTLRGVSHKGGGSNRFRIFLGGGLDKMGWVNISGWDWYPRGHYVVVACGVILTIQTFSKLKTIFCKCWTSTKNKTSFSCVKREWS